MSSKKKAASRPPQRPSQPGFFQQAWAGPTVLVLLTALVYARSLAVPIHDSDDYFYYFRDARLEHLSAENLWRIVTQPFFANFHPLTTLSFAFDRAVWGTWVPGFHLTQLAFYVGGVLVLYLFFARVLASRAGAFVGAALYATHTIHVESVAWLASRKDVVCLFFYALALLAYVRYAGSSTRRWILYVGTAALTGAAMFSKGYAMVLPAVFFAYDLCFSGRIGWRHVVDKIPFVALAVAGTILTVHAQDRDSALVQVSLTAGDRMLRLAEILARYVFHALWPVRLSAFYAFGMTPVARPLAVLGIAFALALPAAFVFLRRRIPAAAFGIALFVLPLATVMNVLFTLRIWMTDRYLLFPTIGSSLAIVALGVSLYRRRARAVGGVPSRAIRRGIAALAVLVIGLYSAMTIDRIGVWTSGVNLWSDVLRKQLGLAGSGPLTSEDLGRSRVRRLVDGSPVVNLMRAYEAAGDRRESGKIAELLGRSAGKDEMVLAREDMDAGRWEDVIHRLKPISEGRTWSAPQALVWMSVAQDRMGRVEESRRTLEQAIQRYRETGQPATDALLDVGIVEFNKGNALKAAEWFRIAYRESPREAKAAFFLGRALEESGNLLEALRLYQQIAQGHLPILPQSQFAMADVYIEMGIVTDRLHRSKEALSYYEEALRRAPDHPKRAGIQARIAALRGRGTP